jgi:hypothetical protein
MSLPNSQLHVLAEIEKELQADQDLADQFSDFTSVTLRAGMPAAEQLGASRSLAGCRNSRRTGTRTFRSRLVVALIGMVAGLLATLALVSVAISGGGQNRCQPVAPGSRVSYAMTCVPSDSAGHSILPGFNPR